MPNRIEQVSPAPSPAPEPKKPLPEWLKPFGLALLGAVLGVACQFIQFAPARAICVAVSQVVSKVGSSTTIEAPDAGQ